MLALSEVRFRYPQADADALSGVSLSLRAGEILGLLGPNGAGKSTLIALLAGVARPDSGSVTHAEGAPARRLGWAPQDFAFYPALSARENLAVFAGAAGLGGAEARQRIDAAVALGQLDSFIDKPALRLSGGMKRRLNLAIAMLADPPVLLLDEPTVGVDPQSRAFLLDAVRALRDQGKAILYTSHYMEEIEAIADRIAILDHGRILREGTLAEICGEAGAQATLRLGGPLPAPLAQAWAARNALQAIGPQAWTLNLARADELSGVLAALAADKVPVLAAQVGNASLEDVFLRLTHRSLRDEA